MKQLRKIGWSRLLYALFCMLLLVLSPVVYALDTAERVSQKHEEFKEYETGEVLVIEVKSMQPA
ncbi:hypothetical protein HZB88_05120, partial [archaeon]|nr:hypothetical protein [archaeon]